MSQSSMKIWIYSNIKNEALRLPYWLRHYQTFADKIIVYDDRSDDGSKEMMLHAGVEVRPCPWEGINDIIYAQFATAQYKEARGKADWIMWVDGDEFIYHPAIRQRLEYLRSIGVTLPVVQGYTMFADAPPTSSGQIYDEIKLGIPDHRYGKPVVLNPAADIAWVPGRHELNTINNVTRDNDGQPPLKLLHYRWLGKEEFLQRNAHIWSAVSDDNKRYGLGVNSAPDSDYPDHTLPWYEERLKEAQSCV